MPIPELVTGCFDVSVYVNLPSVKTLIKNVGFIASSFTDTNHDNEDTDIISRYCSCIRMQVSTGSCHI